MRIKIPALPLLPLLATAVLLQAQEAAPRPQIAPGAAAPQPPRNAVGPVQGDRFQTQYERLYQTDTAFAAHTKAPHLLLKADGTRAEQIIQSVRSPVSPSTTGWPRRT